MNRSPRMKLRPGSPYVKAAMVIIAVCLPILLIAWNVRLLANSLTLYEYAFTQYDAVGRTGLDRAELTSAARQLIDYLNNDERYLDVRVNFNGRQVSLYDEREVLHMADVKDLMRGVWTAGWIATALVVVTVAGGFYFVGRPFASAIRRAVVWSAVGALGFIALVGVASIINFHAVFTLFHEISFANDLWMLDPRTSFLLAMFPQGFWFDATMLLAALTVTQFGLVYALSWWADTRIAGGARSAVRERGPATVESGAPGAAEL